MAEGFQTEIVWKGIAVSITLTKHAFGEMFDHVELRAGKPLTVTQTGYRSHFQPTDPDLNNHIVVA